MSEPFHNQRFAIAQMLLACASFSLMQGLVKSSATHLPSLEIAFFRCLGTLIFIGPYMLKKRIPLVGNNKLLLLVRGLAGATSLCLGFYALATGKIANVSLLWKTSVIFTALFSVLVLKERLTRPLVLYTLLAFLGAALVIKPSASSFSFSDAAALLAGVCVGVVAISIRHLHRSEHALTIVFSFTFIGAFFPLLFFFYDFLWPDALEWLYLAGIGVFGTLGQLFYTRAFQHAPASFIQPYSFAEVLFSMLIGALFWSEFPDLLSIAGGVLIIAAGIGILRGGRGKKGSFEPAEVAAE
jgi:drug/metabolite transporter (DMT)-like permease